ncbi:methyltransferase [Phytoactinopolyspora limicola]|uniref:methyltransferase n=1 Tax=Phytoactinopolyspora limicola TaxID=2715536 RepID=UPI00140D0A8C|nr:methyltransferase [Phytoactinopolyspora limicola]
MSDREHAPTEMMRLIYGAFLSQQLATAADLGVADLLADGPKPVSVLSERTGTDPVALHRVLRGLAAVGVFTEIAPATFGLTPLAMTLRADVPESLRNVARLAGARETHEALAGLEHSIRTGLPSFERAYGTDWWSYLAANPGRASLFHAAMGDVARQTHAAVASAYDFSDRRILVDVGGGHGHLAAAILQRYPEMTAVVFDRPEVVSDVPTTLDKTGVAGRARAEGGDFFERIPENGDVYVLSWILHDWDDDDAATILANVREAMAPGAKVIVIDTLIPPGDEPHLGKLLDIIMLMQHGGKERTEAEMVGVLRAGGLTETEIVELAPWPTALIVAQS